MREKYFAISPETAHAMMAQAQAMEPAKRGFDRRAWLLGEYAVLSTQRLKLRNVDTRDDDLTYLDELIETLLTLKEQGVGVVPFLGYCCDEDSKDGCGYLFAQRARGEEMYDDAVMTAYCVWAQQHPENVYLHSTQDPRPYILRRTRQIADAPQVHFDKFIEDIITLNDHDILIDFLGKSNFFYDEEVGFQFIDLDAHTDFHYGLADQKMDSRALAFQFGFVPCHLSADTPFLSPGALDNTAMAALTPEERQQIAHDNLRIFEKCRRAMEKQGMTEAQFQSARKKLKIYRG